MGISTTVDTNIDPIFDQVITEAENVDLIRVPDKDEIREVLFSMNHWGSPGPDGYPSGVFQSHWGLVEQDVVNLVTNFFETGKLPDSLNDNYISLIPKIENPITPVDFRPISLINGLYKFISKILAMRLKTVLDEIIAPNQSAFIPKRQIVDNIVIAHEMLHTMNTSKSKKGFLALKLDLSKSFDKMEWNFIVKIFKNFGFSDKWCSMIYECISTVKSTVLLNGIPGISFHPSRGLRQGYPLSPYLFITSLKGLSRLFYQAEQNKTFSGMQINKNCPVISHLLFTDDCFIFCRADIAEVQRISKDEKYLGTPLFFNGQMALNFESLLERAYRSLHGWKAKLLSQAGRTMLINSTLSAYPSYQMQCFEFPASVLDKFDKIQRDFWWNINNPKKAYYPNAWCKIAERKIFSRQHPFHKSSYYNPSRIWTSIRKGLEIIKENNIWEVGNGRHIQICKDNWIPDVGVLNNWQHQDLVCVSDLTDVDGKWNSSLIDSVFSNDITCKIKVVFINNQVQDRLRWLGNNNGEFSTKSAYRILSREHHSNRNRIWNDVWKLKTIPRINLFIWKMTVDVLPLRAKMNAALKYTDTWCSLCNNFKEETSAHLFISCFFSRAIWFGLGFTTGPAAEAIALLGAINWVKELNLVNFSIRADCKDAVNFLNNRSSSCDWRSKGILKNVLSFLDHFGTVNINYVHRNYNGEADKLAKWSREKRKSYVQCDSASVNLKNKVLTSIVNRDNVLLYSS
ncbi:uncharacterized protein LOC113315627 [Papaver somniferum]|uniref:uncharacterized protein LOC113315627 n=1 Tax=Papaver somniferum TaxID=3469 RepID=UPI000E70021F|nr:uncharacterized protein LOC113315627 [Papaver somniferum]